MHKGQTKSAEPFEYLVLEGGGIRCAWQAGFLAALESAGNLDLRAVAAVSASTAVACAVAAGRIEFALRCFKRAISGNRKNIYLSNLVRGARPFPHALIYREALLQAFDQAAVDRLRSGPDVTVLVTRTTPNLSKYTGAAVGMCVRALSSTLSGPWCDRVYRKFGFAREFIPVRNCATPSDLADLVLASSCTPPITPWYSLGGRPVLDGGLAESIPLSGLPPMQRRTLVLLTAPRKNFVAGPNAVVAAPGQLKAASWDYSDADKIDELFELGIKDGKAFMELLGQPQLMAAQPN